MVFRIVCWSYHNSNYQHVIMIMLQNLGAEVILFELRQSICITYTYICIC